MTNLSILKIESSDGTLLVSRHATQEIIPVMKEQISRDLDFNALISSGRPRPMKLRCLIETTDLPNIPLLKLYNPFKIYSIVKFRHNKPSELPQDHVEDSIEEHDDHTIFRPIINALLINFSCKGTNYSREEIWRLELEEP
ncbi:MAG: hypothetical protein LBJ69_01670 [Holosporales bacterium]|jgi:hypothetical protein|nr:hypothetical protein [Holosporales bacterium]